MSEIGIRRICPACRAPMRVVDGSQRSTRTMTYYVLECTSCLLRLDGCKPKRTRKKPS